MKVKYALILVLTVALMAGVACFKTTGGGWFNGALRFYRPYELRIREVLIREGLLRILLLKLDRPNL